MYAHSGILYFLIVSSSLVSRVVFLLGLVLGLCEIRNMRRAHIRGVRILHTAHVTNTICKAAAAAAAAIFFEFDCRAAPLKHLLCIEYGPQMHVRLFGVR